MKRQMDSMYPKIWEKTGNHSQYRHSPMESSKTPTKQRTLLLVVVLLGVAISTLLSLSVLVTKNGSSGSMFVFLASVPMLVWIIGGMVVLGSGLLLAWRAQTTKQTTNVSAAWSDWYFFGPTGRITLQTVSRYLQLHQVELLSVQRSMTRSGAVTPGTTPTTLPPDETGVYTTLPRSNAPMLEDTDIVSLGTTPTAVPPDETGVYTTLPRSNAPMLEDTDMVSLGTTPTTAPPGKTGVYTALPQSNTLVLEDTDMVSLGTGGLKRGNRVPSLEDLKRYRRKQLQRSRNASLEQEGKQLNASLTTNVRKTTMLE